MHAADFGVGVLGANAIVGAAGAILTGAVWERRRRGADSVGVTFFGDGAVNEGMLLEAFNLAALWRVPVLFVCENNGYATTMPVEGAVAGTIAGRAAAFGMPAAAVDGQDPEAVREVTAAAVARMRAGGGPELIECPHLPLRRPPHLRTSGTPRLPAAGGGGRRAGPAIPCDIAGRAARPRRYGPRSTPRSRRNWTRPSSSRSPARTPTRRPRWTTCTPAGSPPGPEVADAPAVLPQGAHPGARRRDGPRRVGRACSARTSGWPPPTSPPACSSSSARNGSSTRRCPSRRSPASPPARRWPGPARWSSSRSRRCCSWSSSRSSTRRTSSR